MDLSRLTAALGLMSAASAMIFTAGLALVFRYLGPFLMMGAHIYAGDTEPSEVHLPFPVWAVLGCLLVAGALATRARQGARWSAASVVVSMIGFAVELRWLLEVYAASGS
ncbi:MAG: hypothetical protein H6741_03925 [Alphaproteobacteria bacterium]|nr:hypothetical protein [Alphaproteobacteria bacterium]MCB9791854.1 hypothetical protein [Alphaproteobacteria bacterium]